MTETRKNKSMEDTFRDGAPNPPGFIFEEEGAWITGRLVRYSESVHTADDEPKAYPILVLEYIESEGGAEKVGGEIMAGFEESHMPGEEVSVHVFHEALWSRLERENPVPGEKVGIMFRGKRQARNSDREYNDFAVFVEREEKSGDFRSVVERMGMAGEFRAPEELEG